MDKKEIGYVGLGKMGKNMVTRLVEKGWGVVATDVSTEAVKEISVIGARGVVNVQELVGALSSPRLLWVMVPHQVVDTVLQELVSSLSPGDVVIDGGNSNYKDTMRRAEELGAKGVEYLDAGTSGGPGGARNGACVMVGGKRELFNRYEELFRDMAAPDAYGYMGKSGSGHFVKMVHNGIEYGMMQAIAEGFSLMKSSDLEPDLKEVARIYDHQSVIESRLIQWLGEAYERYGVGLNEISGKVSHSGEGLWTVEAAREIGVPVAVIEESLKFREDSQSNPSYTGQVVSALRNMFGGHEVKKEKE
ncbi:MAG: 6-phosphogluconate dehydrogenase (decarboxylating) [Candidatus Yonathbacteria bacterium CG_4_10_14_3_um_filter_47_65]|uniref:6-phosphogluconate dehydrogenase (Decarboxylating) n=2 Tax=Parcubacteria group TaxID=1794811 RepID=A0A2M8D6X3_9BACT|nr:MAG: 6-phosphogluconate dehydrogenase (decarboxylating) [Candidatus Nomurabacteria bacterium CG1_02_47_685]PIP03225.1 MAG: 6-phosphogluconate dehydrogenase (decarboxylating) [Candidatus Yonathbacteria bacterium CG23_combo_of_CG06-09_8_20_14_all_46_18]PIQ33084.1 MAG: 6-phosphogluconate dehydrogenase (decarboxylating) [Candidatus Yonathbacteria bacterium CG17_big_fil_post_rev_8_21_14_2_50_46_19]PIX56648.1 MAG: 6-phosphogluconate dehydrogenase (decarboxylating) [Candidatus Yonathbacteria bacteri